MSTRLVVVRHAQASAGEADYDQLSPLGFDQARRLGAWLAAHHPQGFAQVLTGDLRRHRETEATIAQAFRDADLALPEAARDAAFDEFDHHAVLRAFARHGAGADLAALARSGAPPDPRDVYRMLRVALGVWSRGELDDDLHEGWHAFSARATRAAARLGALAPDERPVLVVSSGGLISQLARLALGIPAETSVELNLTLRNSAISEFRVHEGRLLLQSWNALPHLAGAADRALWTYY